MRATVNHTQECRETNRQRVLASTFYNSGSRFSACHVAQLLKCEASTANRLLRHMAEKGDISKHVNGKKTEYSAYSAGFMSTPWVPENNLPIGRYYPGMPEPIDVLDVPPFTPRRPSEFITDADYYPLPCAEPPRTRQLDPMLE